MSLTETVDRLGSVSSQLQEETGKTWILYRCYRESVLTLQRNSQYKEISGTFCNCLRFNSDINFNEPRLLVQIEEVIRLQS